MKKTRCFEHVPDSVPRARRFVKEVLKDAPSEVCDTVALMVSELATNCVRHTDSGFELTIGQNGGEIRVEVTDRGSGEPKLRTPASTDTSGRGLQIVDIFSNAWGHESQGEGKTVWFSVGLEATTAA